MDRENFEELKGLNENIREYNSKIREFKEKKFDIFKNSINVDDYFKKNFDGQGYLYIKILECQVDRFKVLEVNNNNNSEYCCIKITDINSYDYEYMFSDAEKSTEDEFNTVKNNILIRLMNNGC